MATNSISNNETQSANNEKPCLKIFVIGKSGVGKSSLINAVLSAEVAVTGVGFPVTRGWRAYDGVLNGLPTIFYDSEGYEFGRVDYFVRSILEANDTEADKIKREVLLAWVVISASSGRIDDDDVAIISALSRKKIPTIVVLSKADLISSQGFDLMKSVLQGLPFKLLDILAVASESRTLRTGKTRPFGLEDLIHQTSQLYLSEFPQESISSTIPIVDAETSEKLLEELEEWKLEAKLESTAKYFYHTKTIDRLSNGKKLYVVGRKGTGKTAICEHLISIDRESYFSQKITFKNFPFNILYELSDSEYTQPNQYITIWKYLIYSVVCNMLIDNPRVDRKTRKNLRNVFKQDIKDILPRAITDWTSFKFDLKILGSGVGIGASKTETDNKVADISRGVEYLESLIRAQSDSSTYMILFDELDEDYKPTGIKKDNRYISLLTSLFKAVQDIRSVLGNYRVLPVVFLRNDIYNIIQDSDKNKWSDYKIELDWNQDSLKNLLAFRISRSFPSNNEILPFLQAWGLAFTQEDILLDGTFLSIFSYIKECTHNRPRDFIKYIQICAESALEKGSSRISSSIVQASEKAFSNYLRAEIEDEAYGVIPEIKQILNLFTKLRSRNIEVSEFRKIYQSELEKENITERDYRYVLEILFSFSAIGNISGQSGQAIFLYENKESRLNLNEDICVHRGLLKSLQIL